MKTINFYSYKGGVGRTMLTGQIARCLVALGKKVVVADFDFDAPGIPAVFGTKLCEIKHGLFELTRKLMVQSDDEDDAELSSEALGLDRDMSRLVSSYLIKIDLKLNPGGNGSLHILPSGKLDEKYFHSISRIERADADQRSEHLPEPKDVLPSWPEIVAGSSKKREFSLVYILEKVIKPSLASMGVDYFLIDARAGITHYGNIARDISDSQVMLFCTNEEAKMAMRHFLLPDISKYQNKRKLFDELIFIISRMPPEKTDRNNVFDVFTKLIKEGYTHDNYIILRLSSDLDTHFDSTIRTIDDKYVGLVDAEGFKVSVNSKVDIVPLHEDIMSVLAALCQKELSEHRPVHITEAIEQGHRLWEKIFDYPFTITHENRLFGFLERAGEMLNEDGKRNVAFKIVTFLNFLNKFNDTLRDNYPETYSRTLNRALYDAGKQCGDTFGISLLEEEWLNENLSARSDEWKIKKWCEFDTRAGFGHLSYFSKVVEEENNQGEKEKREVKYLKVVNLFIHDPVVTNNQDYTEFFTGYINGVLQKILYDTKLRVYPYDKSADEGRSIVYVIEKPHKGADKIR